MARKKVFGIAGSNKEVFGIAGRNKEVFGITDLGEKVSIGTTTVVIQAGTKLIIGSTSDSITPGTKIEIGSIVNPQDLSSLTIIGEWENPQFINNNVDTTGIVVAANYGEYFSRLVEPTLSRNTWGDTPGEQSITFSYTEGGITVSATATVNINKKLTGLTVSGDWVTQFYNNPVDTTGLSFIANYEYGSPESITPDTISPSVWGGIGTQTATFSYSENGITVSNNLEFFVNRVLDKLIIEGNWENPTVKGQPVDTSGLKFFAKYTDSDDYKKEIVPDSQSLENWPSEGDSASIEFTYSEFKGTPYERTRKASFSASLVDYMINNILLNEGDAYWSTKEAINSVLSVINKNEFYNYPSNFNGENKTDLVYVEDNSAYDTVTIQGGDSFSLPRPANVTCTSGEIDKTGIQSKGTQITNPGKWNISELYQNSSLPANSILSATGSWNNTSFNSIMKVTNPSTAYISEQTFYNDKSNGNGDWDWWSDTYTVPSWFKGASVTVWGNIGWTENWFDRFHGGAQVFVNGSSVAYWPKDMGHESYSWSGTVSAGDTIQVHMIGAQNKTHNERGGNVNIKVSAQTLSGMGFSSNGIYIINTSAVNGKTKINSISNKGTETVYTQNENSISLASPVSWNSQDNLFPATITYDWSQFYNGLNLVDSNYENPVKVPDNEIYLSSSKNLYIKDDSGDFIYNSSNDSVYKFNGMKKSTGEDLPIRSYSQLNDDIMSSYFYMRKAGETQVGPIIGDRNSGNMISSVSWNKENKSLSVQVGENTYTIDENTYLGGLDLKLNLNVPVRLEVSGTWGYQYINTAPDTSGLTYTVTYTDGTTENVNAVCETSTWGSTPGEQVCTFSFTKRETKIEETKKANVVRKLTGLSISGSWTNTQYINTAVDTTGLSFTANYEDGFTASVTPSVSPSSWGSTVGTQTATFSYTENGISVTASKSASVIKSGITDSWDTIAERADAGTAAQYYAVGDYKEVSVAAGTVDQMSVNAGTYRAVIIGINHNPTYENPNSIDFAIGQNTSGTDICFYNSTGVRMNTSDVTTGGWTGSQMYLTYLPQFYALLSGNTGLQDAMIAPKKYTHNYTGGSRNNSATYVTLSEDPNYKMFLMAAFEIAGNRAYANSYEQDKQMQYDYYSSSGLAKSKVRYRTDTGAASYWWERSAYCDLNERGVFCSVESGGLSWYSDASYTCGLVPCFRVGKGPDPVLNNNSWETIKQVADAGTAAQLWSVGDYKEVSVAAGTVDQMSVNAGTYRAVIIGINHNPTYENPNSIDFAIGQNTSGTDICFRDGGTGVRMNTSNDTTGGWTGSQMYLTYLPQFYNLLSGNTGLQSAMIAPKKYTNNVGGGSSNNIEANVTLSENPNYKMFLMAEYEIFGTRSYANSYEQNKQAQYYYYSSSGLAKSKVRYRADTGSANNWWERSSGCRYSSTVYFCDVYYDDGAHTTGASNANGLCPCFRV